MTTDINAEFDFSGLVARDNYDGRMMMHQHLTSLGFAQIDSGEVPASVIESFGHLSAEEPFAYYLGGEDGYAGLVSNYSTVFAVFRISALVGN